MLIYKNANCFLLAIAVFFSCLATSTQIKAQITGDGTVSTEVETVDNRNFTITGGTQEGNNLFHSFSEFSVPNQGLASFENSANIQNIISRVTGDSLSNIEGLIKAQGNANLLLINPQGIVFGSNSRLDIGGSFLATTADSIHFADGTKFAVTDTQTTPLLTITAPVGLGFGKTPGRIMNRAMGFDINGFPDGLSVKSGKTLAFVGGEVLIDGGFMFSPGGRIEIGSVDSFNFADLNPVSEGWILGYEAVENFEDIKFSQAFVTTSHSLELAPNGNIQIRGEAITVTNKSIVEATNLGNIPGGTITLNASDLVEISDVSVLSTLTSSDGKAGDIYITTKRLLVGNDSSIDANSQNIFDLGDFGDGGNLTVNASESIEVRGEFALLATRTSTNGQAGDINLTTEKLILSDGGQVSSSTFGVGKAGNIIVNDSKLIEISAQSNDLSNELGSGLFSQTSGNFATGNGGNIEIFTERLNIKDGGRVSVGAVDGSQGRAGTLSIYASESVNIDGSGSILLAESESSQPAGDLTIATNKLTVTNQGEVNVSATGAGEAGSLNINAQDINLDRGTLTAETQAGNKGNITISNAETLLLRNNSKITTNATTEATGGNITIDADAIAGLNNSDITANAEQGQAGKVTINASRGVIGLEVREQEDADTSDITATSDLGVEFNGEIIFNTPDIDPLNGLIELPTIPLDAEAIFAQNLCKFEDGKIAKGSSFIITGKGGITPTSKNPLGDRDRVVNWANRDDLKVSQDGVVGVVQRTSQETLETSDRIIEQAQGWVVTADGSVWLTADNPEATLQSSGLVHPDCLSPVQVK